MRLRLSLSAKVEPELERRFDMTEMEYDAMTVAQGLEPSVR